MYALNLISIKLLRLLVPLVQRSYTPRSSQEPPKPDASTSFPSPSPQAGASSRRINASIYLPSPNPSPTSTVIALPIIINLHGSGFCFHSFGDDASFCHYLATALTAVIIDVDYSHAPERPWPAAVEDVDAAINWAREFARIGRKSRKANGPILGPDGKPEWEWDENRIALTGFSSGGNLALVASTRSQQNGGVQAVVAFYPSTNLAEPANKKPQLSPDPGAAGGVIPPWMRNLFYSSYIPSSVAPDRKDPAISPLYATPSSFPPSVTVITCEKDSLAREGGHLIGKLRGRWAPEGSEPNSAEVYKGDSLLWTAKGQGHGWDKMVREGTEPARLKDEAYALTVKRLGACFAKVAVGHDDEMERDLRDDS
ncbi:alpha/beta-hydrolase [Violaceomyces palustris]|uniref:Alpha/beta-hydrolase n=1 Tax=Violaceomyces palustris TaxID=1673888 RepID=A0ACD0P116_9BASI|nr:alpha/beta-hydrolase [Violaceomyces palustris]